MMELKEQDLNGEDNGGPERGSLYNMGEEGGQANWVPQKKEHKCQWVAEHQHLLCTALSIVLTWLTIVNYRSMREECPDFTEHECLSFIKSKLHRWVTLICIDSIFSVVQIFLFWFRKGSRVVTVIGVAQIFYLFFNTQHSLSTTKYIGAVNFLHIVIIFGITMMVTSVLVFANIYRKWPKETIIAAFVFLLLVVTVGYTRVHNSCSYWPEGINGRIEDSPGKCKITVPQICWYKVLNGFFDASFFLRDCHLSSSDRQNFKKYYHKAMMNGPFVSFSNPTYFDETQRRYYSIYREVYSLAKGFQSMEEARSSPEAFDIIFDSQRQKYHIDVVRNQTLVRERSQLREKQKDTLPLASNVLLIYTDAIGRPSMHFKFPKTVSFFKERSQEKSYNYQKAEEPAGDKDQAYEFYRYNSYFPWTVPNQNKMYYQNISEEANLSAPLKRSVFRQFEEKGFILGTSATLCQIMSMAYFREDLETTHFDHELFSYACDPNFQDPENVDYIFEGPYSIGKHCLYDRIMAEYATDAALSFFRAYSDQPKVFSIQFVQGHESSGDVIDYIDDPIASLLATLQKEQLLQDTVVMLYSDHGYHMQGALQLINPANVKLEDGLPGLMVSLPSKVNQLYRKQIALNQQALVTAYNIFYFLSHIAQGQDYPNQHNGLLGSLEGQTCANLNITDYECKCKNL